MFKIKILCNWQVNVKRRTWPESNFFHIVGTAENNEEKPNLMKKIREKMFGKFGPFLNVCRKLKGLKLYTGYSLHCSFKIQVSD